MRIGNTTIGAQLFGSHVVGTREGGASLFLQDLEASLVPRMWEGSLKYPIGGAQEALLTNKQVNVPDKAKITHSTTIIQPEEADTAREVCLLEDKAANPVGAFTYINGSWSLALTKTPMGLDYGFTGMYTTKPFLFFPLTDNPRPLRAAMEITAPRLLAPPKPSHGANATAALPNTTFLDTTPADAGLLSGVVMYGSLLLLAYIASLGMLAAYYLFGGSLRIASRPYNRDVEILEAPFEAVLALPAAAQDGRDESDDDDASEGSMESEGENDDSQEEQERGRAETTETLLMGTTRALRPSSLPSVTSVDEENERDEIVETESNGHAKAQPAKGKGKARAAQAFISVMSAIASAMPESPASTPARRRSTSAAPPMEMLETATPMPALRLSSFRLSFSDRFRSESAQQQQDRPVAFSMSLDMSPREIQLKTIEEERAALDNDESKRDDAETVAAREAERRRLATAAGELRMQMSTLRKLSIGDKIKGAFTRRRSSSTTRWGRSVSGQEAKMVVALCAPRRKSWTVAL